MDDDAYRPTSARRRVLIGLLAVVTTIVVLLTLLERRGRIDPDPRLLAPDKPLCAPGKDVGCVGGKAEVIVVPQPASR